MPRHRAKLKKIKKILLTYYFFYQKLIAEIFGDTRIRTKKDVNILQ